MCRDSGIKICDVTNREGVQAAGVYISRFARTMMNLQLGISGVSRSEVGFPALMRERPYINANLELGKLEVFRNMELSGWCRAIEEDVLAAISNCPGLSRLSLSLPVSEPMLNAKFGGKRLWSSVLDEAIRAVTAAGEHGVQSITLNLEDAARASLDRLCRAAALGVGAGADAVCYSDTLGVDEPFRIRRRARRLAEIAARPVEVHVHNDLGMAVASSLAAAQGITEAGQDARLHASVNGLGERAGIADLMTLVLALRYSMAADRADGCNTDTVDTSMLASLSRYVAMESGLTIPPGQPGLGSRIFMHESGVHTDGMLKVPGCYETYPESDVGRGAAAAWKAPERRIGTGEFGGIHGLSHIFDGLGCGFNDNAEAREVLRLVQHVSSQVRRALLDEELIFIRNYPDITARLMEMPSCDPGVRGPGIEQVMY